jgi:hypothetical protein
VPASAGLLLGLHFDPEDGGNIFLRNSEKFFELHGVTNQKTTFAAIVIFVRVGNSNGLHLEIVLQES